MTSVAALHVPARVREAVADGAWLQAMLDADALAVQARATANRAALLAYAEGR